MCCIQNPQPEIKGKSLPVSCTLVVLCTMILTETPSQGPFRLLVVNSPQRDVWCFAAGLIPGFDKVFSYLRIYQFQFVCCVDLQSTLFFLKSLFSTHTSSTVVICQTGKLMRKCDFSFYLWNISSVFDNKLQETIRLNTGFQTKRVLLVRDGTLVHLSAFCNK